LKLKAWANDLAWYKKEFSAYQRQLCGEMEQMNSGREATKPENMHVKAASPARQSLQKQIDELYSIVKPNKHRSSKSVQPTSQTAPA
jgi:hypothetical protein